jgi:hypothetical protein
MPKAQLIEFETETEGGGKIYVEGFAPPESESEKIPGGAVLAGGLRDTAERVMTTTREAFAKTLEGITPALESAMTAINRLARKPDEFEINFGFTLGAKGDIKIVAAEGEANFNVRVLWKHDRNSE